MVRKKLAILGWLVVVGAFGCRPSRESVSAGQVGCNPDEIQISNEDSSTGWSQNSETWTAECNGHIFICSQLNSTSSALVSNGKAATVVGVNSSDVSCHERLSDTAAAQPSAKATTAAAAPRALPTAPAPTTGVGFALGADPETARQACEAAGQTWAAPVKGRAMCSGPATELGFPADVAIKFCSGKACIITAHHRPESEWTSMFAELKGKLTEKYGAPQESEAVVPAGCRTESDLVECLTNRGVRLHFSWSWPTGERVILSIGKAEPESDAAIRIDYTRPVRKVAANASAL